MQKVYLVHYDNGMNYGDHYTYVDKVFLSKESADVYAEEKNVPIQIYTPSVTEEKYISENWVATNGCTYNQFVENEYYVWGMSLEEKYYVSETDVHP